MRVRMIGAVAIAAALGLPVVAHEGHEHATGVVKERMVAMDGMAARMKAITERIRDKRELAAIKADAAAVAEQASHIPHLFPPGSTQHPTQARAAVWQNWSDFARRARALELASGQLANTSPDDIAALRTQARAVSQACSGCHEKYRMRK